MSKFKLFLVMCCVSLIMLGGFILFALPVLREFFGGSVSEFAVTQSLERLEDVDFSTASQVEIDQEVYTEYDAAQLIIDISNGYINIDSSTLEGRILGNLAHFGGTAEIVPFGNDIDPSISKIASNSVLGNKVDLQLGPIENVYVLSAFADVGGANFNLRNTQVKEASIAIGAGNTTLTLPNSIASVFSVSSGQGQFKIIVPKEIEALRIKAVDGAELDVSTLEGFKDSIYGSYDWGDFSSAKVRSTITFNYLQSDLVIEFENRAVQNLQAE